MAALVPLLRHLLPMIMPSSIHIQKAPVVSTRSGPQPGTSTAPNDSAMYTSSLPPSSGPYHPSEIPDRQLDSSSPLQHVSWPAQTGDGPTALNNPPQPSPYDVPQDPQYYAAHDYASSASPHPLASPNPYAQGGYPYMNRGASEYIRVGSPDSDGPRIDPHLRVEDDPDLDGLDYSDHSGPPTPNYRNKEIPGQSALRVTNQLVNRNDYMCASALELDAHSHTSIRHHGEQETIIYVISGTLILSTKPDLEGDIVTNIIAKGDFVCIPPWTEHQLRNDADDAASWLAMRNASLPITVDLVDWGEEEIEPLVTDSD